MSYDLMVFEPAIAPGDHAAFIAWFTKQTEWEEGRVYDDPMVASPRLREWLSAMREVFPDMNGGWTDEQLADDDGSLSDYTIGEKFIYAGFAWSKAEKAATIAMELAAQHGLAFFDVSSAEGGVWVPEGGALRLKYQKGATSLLQRLIKIFKLK